MSGETGGGLTAEDRKEIENAHHMECGCTLPGCGTRAGLSTLVSRAKRRALADRGAALARVEALAKNKPDLESEFWTRRWFADLDAALHPDPSEANSEASPS